MRKKEEPEPLYRLHASRLKLLLRKPKLSAAEVSFFSFFFPNNASDFRRKRQKREKKKMKQKRKRERKKRNNRTNPLW
jgi:hypothetical protein